MTTGTKSRAQVLTASPGFADNEIVNRQELSQLITAGKEIRDRWGVNFLALEYDMLLESAFKETGAPQHTIDHVDCPACQFIDKRMNSDLRGMANQTFSEAAKVWQGVRRNSNILRYRTHESTEETSPHLASSSVIFKCVRLTRAC